MTDPLDHDPPAAPTRRPPGSRAADRGRPARGYRKHPRMHIGLCLRGAGAAVALDQRRADHGPVRHRLPDRLPPPTMRSPRPRISSGSAISALPISPRPSCMTLGFLGPHLLGLRGQPPCQAAVHPARVEPALVEGGAVRAALVRFLEKEPKKYVGHNPLAQIAMFFFMTLGITFMIFTGFALYAEGLGQGSLGRCAVRLDHPARGR
jgi:hypothetical protein